MICKKLSGRTIRYAYTILRAAIHQGKRWHVLLNDPTDGVELPRQRRREIRVLNTEQARGFLKAVLDSPHACVFAIALTTGMRPCEYLALTWPDIDWALGTASVVRTLYRNEGQWIFEETKTPRGRRRVKLQTWVLSLLRKIKNEQEESPFSELIFVTPSGEPIREEYLVKKHFKPILREAGLPDIRLYDLRHTCATLALTVGVPPKVVSEQLGHASAAFTLDTYSHVLPHMQDEAAAKMEALLTSEIPLPK